MAQFENPDFELGIMTEEKEPTTQPLNEDNKWYAWAVFSPPIGLGDPISYLVAEPFTRLEQAQLYAIEREHLYQRHCPDGPRLTFEFERTDDPHWASVDNHGMQIYVMEEAIPQDSRLTIHLNLFVWNDFAEIAWAKDHDVNYAYARVPWPAGEKPGEEGKIWMKVCSYPQKMDLDLFSTLYVRG